MNAEEVTEEIRKLRLLRTQARLWRTAATLAIVLIVLASTGLLVSQVYGLFRPGPDQEAFTAALQDNAQKQILPAVETIAGQAITESKPEVQAALGKLNDRVPELTSASLQQMELLRQNLPKRGNAVLMATFGRTINRENAKIRAMFPEATDQSIATLITNVSTEAQSQSADQGDALLGRHVKALNAVMGDLAHIQATEPVNAQADRANWEMALLVVDGFHDDLKSLESQENQGGQVHAAAKEARK